MRTETGQTFRLGDYRPPDWLVESVDLNVSLHPSRTKVRASLLIKPNPQGSAAPLIFDGDGLTLVSLKLDGAPLPPENYTAAPDRLTIAQPPQRPFRLEIETLVDPTGNTQLSGLYRSSGTYCTQCEAEGFRRITYFPDRPDVMAIYSTRIEADKAECPVLLSNGNLAESGELPDGRHFATWRDPFPKPSYLFALVGGNLGCVDDLFVTRSGREVALKIYVEPGKENRCSYAMDSLKRAMRWDEEAFGCEYDLDIFMIVAVSDFNMGAMENKGLNIFNDKYVLASSDTATDADFAGIEAVIAHEYFHNWTGDRITCRDWFQLCLKEGLTVFRDQEFTSDQRSRAVKRISDVRNLRNTQFIEDAGPLAHPVRPETYKEINNFYTTTVYEKGAEVVRMIKTIVGEQNFRAGMDLYFKRHDGEAATVEQFVQCFADASGRDFSQFMLWYSQAGTPQVTVVSRYDAATKTLTLDCTQSLRPTPGQPNKQPMLIPLRFGLIGSDGRDLPLPGGEVVLLKQSSERFAFTGLDETPIISINRGFSAPIKLTTGLSSDDLVFLAAHDSDPFNRWQAIQSIAMDLLVANTAAIRTGKEPAGDERLISALAAVLADGDLQPAFVALALTPPGEADIAREIGSDIDPDAIYRARFALRREIGSRLAAELAELYRRTSVAGPYSPDAESAGRRALRNVALDLLVTRGSDDDIALAQQQYDAADNMTDRFAALSTLVMTDLAAFSSIVMSGTQMRARKDALADFYRRHQGDALVIDKWFSLQAMAPRKETVASIVALSEHPDFSFANPNRVRALIGAFAHSNPTQFNSRSGTGYFLLAQFIRELDGKNPQIAARLATAFRSWRTMDAERREAAERALKEIKSVAGLSRDVSDIVERALAPA